VKIDGVRKYIPLKSQLSADRLVTLARYVVKLDANKHYTRRVTWLHSGDNVPGDIAVVEYIAEHVPGGPHGLCTATTDREPYQRTSKETMASIAALKDAMTAKALYIKLTRDL
jgi:hypothetical protein